MQQDNPHGPTGFITISRKITEWQWYTDIPTKTLFFHCIIKANHRDKFWRGVQIKRGQFVTSRKTLAHETGLSEQQVRTALRKLALEIVVTSTSKLTVLTVSQYDTYQATQSESNQQPNHKITSHQPVINQSITTTNNDNNNNNENKEQKTTGASGSEAFKAFIEFYTQSTESKIRAQDYNRWRAVIREIQTLATEDIVPVLEWAKDNYRGAIGDVKWFNPGVWGKIHKAHQNALNGHANGFQGQNRGGPKQQINKTATREEFERMAENQEIPF